MKKDLIRTQAIIDLFPQNINICIHDINTNTYFGKNMKRGMYPASMFKILIGAFVLDCCEKGVLYLTDIIEIQQKIWRQDVKIFPNDIKKHLCDGETRSIDELLSLMLKESDNTATHSLLNLVGYQSIEKLILTYDFSGTVFSEEFKESIINEKTIRKSEILETTAFDMVRIFKKIHENTLVSELVCSRLIEYISYDYSLVQRKGLFLKDYSRYYGKGGFVKINLWQLQYWRSLINNIFRLGIGCTTFRNDVCYVKGEQSEYVICVMSKKETVLPNNGTDLGFIAKKIFEYLENGV